MMKRILLTAAIAALAWGAGVSGKWTGQMADSNRDVVLQLKMDGDKVGGTMSGPNGEPRPISKGELKGEDISLTVDSEWEGQPVKLYIKGKVTGDEMKATISSEGGEWSTEVVLKKSGS